MSAAPRRMANPTRVRTSVYQTADCANCPHSLYRSLDLNSGEFRTWIHGVTGEEQCPHLTTSPDDAA